MKRNGYRGKREEKRGRLLSEQVDACPLGKPVLAPLRRQFAQYLKAECQANLSRRGIYAVGDMMIGAIGKDHQNDLKSPSA